MSRPDQKGSRAYRLLLRLWPRAHRERYGAEMEDAFVSLMQIERDRRSSLGVIGCWLGALADAVCRGLWMRWDSWTWGGGDMVGTWISDVRYALRSLKRRPIFAATAVLTIAIGIGANTAVFTLVNGFMLSPLPYGNSDRLVALWAAKPSLGWSGMDINYADAWDWRDRATTLSDLAVFDDEGFNLTGGERPELVAGVRVTPNFFSVLESQPALGRDFFPEEIGEGRDGVVILTDGFWDRRFGRDPSVLGSTLT